MIDRGEHAERKQRNREHDEVRREAAAAQLKPQPT